MSAASVVFSWYGEVLTHCLALVYPLSRVQTPPVVQLLHWLYQICHFCQLCQLASTTTRPTQIIPYYSEMTTCPHSLVQFYQKIKLCISGLQIPLGCGEIHHEIELGVVIASTCKRVDTADALRHVGGYVLALDMTGRDFQVIIF